MTRYRYIECDGKVYLAEKDGVFSLLAPEDPIDFEYESLAELECGADSIEMCRAELSKHPHHWPDKDELPLRNDVQPLARWAANRSLVREIVNAVIVKDDLVLMVKGARGLTEGVWHLPGGFVGYLEDPEETVVRELREELSIEIRTTGLLGRSSRIFKKGQLFIRGHIFLAEIVSGTPTPDPGEISEFGWFPKEEVIPRLERTLGYPPEL